MNKILVLFILSFLLLLLKVEGQIKQSEIKITTDSVKYKIGNISNKNFYLTVIHRGDGSIDFFDFPNPAKDSGLIKIYAYAEIKYKNKRKYIQSNCNYDASPFGGLVSKSFTKRELQFSTQIFPECIQHKGKYKVRFRISYKTKNSNDSMQTAFSNWVCLEVI